MASHHRPPRNRRVPVALIAFASLLLPLPAHALRIVNYNILNYPGSTGSARAPYYRTVLAPLNADVIVAQEVSSSTGPTQFLNEVLNVLEPGQWATVPFIDGNDTDASIFYKPSKVQFQGQTAFYPNPASLLRYIHAYRLQPVGYTSRDAQIRIYTAHLKASTGYESQRLAECVGIRDSLNAMPAGTHALLCGDLNFYKASTEPGYTKLRESQANNIGRLYDLLPSGDWHDNASFAAYHTQSPCLSGTCASGAATGGMDDRFDFILPTYNLVTGQGLSVIPGSMIPVGNDGQHLNKNITDSPTLPEGTEYATALKLASDHLPLRVDLQMPAKIATEPSLAFGTVIVGAPVQTRNLIVDNPALAPADSLDCVFAAPTGFDAPASLAIGAASSALALISMQTSSIGNKSGDLSISSDAPDDPMTLVTLSGTVLAHAEASLDSLAAVAEGMLDFGEQEAGGFSPLVAEVHNRGWDSQHARLSVSAAEIAGGNGRFSIQGFNPTLVAGTGARWQVIFDDEGCVSDSTYEAMLTFSCADENLPGALTQPSVRYVLRARQTGGVVDAGSYATLLPTRLLQPKPNPVTSGCTIGFDLAYGTNVRLEVFDIVGRRVALLADRRYPTGSHGLYWDVRAASGSAVEPGLYFVRMTARGFGVQTERLVVVH